MEVSEVFWAALGQVDVCLGGDTDGDGGVGHEGGIGGLFSAEDNEGCVGVVEVVLEVGEVFGHAGCGAEVSVDDEVGVVGELVELLGDVGGGFAGVFVVVAAAFSDVVPGFAFEATGVGVDVVGSAAAGGEEVGVGGG